MQDVMVLLTWQLCHKGIAYQLKVLSMPSLFACVEVPLHLSMGLGRTHIWLHLC